jgi:hypothetical protein
MLIKTKLEILIDNVSRQLQWTLMKLYHLEE